MSEPTQTVQQDVLHTMTAELLQKLHSVPILDSLQDNQLDCLIGAQQVHLDADTIVARQGEVAHHFWILLEGRIRVYQVVADGREITYHTITEGNTFGEVPLLSNIPGPANLKTETACHLLRLDEDGFWSLMTSCPQVRKAILGNMALRFQKMQNIAFQQEKMASLGTLAAGLMHELNNPGAAARRSASQLRENLLRLHELSARFTKRELSLEQKQCMFDLQHHVLSIKAPLRMNSLEQSDAEEALAEWMESANIENAWKLAPTLVAIGVDSSELECAHTNFPGDLFSDALNWLEAMASSQQLVSTIEESIGRVSDLVKAVKSYAYEGKGQRQSLDVNDSIHATLVILGHKLREKEIVLEKDFAADLPHLTSDCSGLNQIWTNLLDNSIDAVPQHGTIAIHTWTEKTSSDPANAGTDLCISIRDNGTGIPPEAQPHIFDPFFTTKEVGVGSGLGLGIVHRIVEQFGGHINYTSQPGNTEFVVRLPSARLPESKLSTR